jgi:hypothetical protein
MALPYYLPMRQMRKRGERVLITTGKYTGHRGVIEANVFQITEDHPGELANGYHVMLDTDDLVTIRQDQVESSA